jgi:tetratricopeptide (TPR) repeat protein
MRILAFGQPLWGDPGHLALYKSAHGHEVRTAGPAGDFDYLFEPRETAREFVARVSREWAPDVLLCSLPEMHPPPLAIEDSPIPAVAVISDWNLYGPQLEHNLCRFDAVLSDLPATRSLKIHGIQPQFLFPMYSHMTHIHRFIERPRDIDVLFLGNLNHAIHRARGQVLEKIARHSQGLRVVIDAGLPPEQYALRLNEAKIAINFGVRGEMNLRCFEAPACGALLFIEEDNQETFDWLEPWEQCVPYNSDNILELIQRFLRDDAAREAIAEAGRQRVLELAAEKRLDMLFGWLERVVRGPRLFHALDARRRALAEAMLYGSSMDVGQRAHAREVLMALRDSLPQDGEVLLACGCSAFDHAAALGNAPAQKEMRQALVRESIGAFDAAQRALPDEAVPLLDLAIISRQAGAAAVEESYLLRAVDAPAAAHGGYLLGKVADPFYADLRLMLAMGRDPADLLRASAWTRLAELRLAQKDPASALAHAEEAIARAPAIAAPYFLAGRAAQALGELESASRLLQAGLPLTSFDAAHRQALIEVLRALGNEQDARAIADESARIFSVCPPLAVYVPLFEGTR